MKAKARKTRTPQPMLAPGDEPLFEIFTGPRATPKAKRYAVYASGRVEGFGKHPAVINRLAKLISELQKRTESAQARAIEDLLRGKGVQ